MALKRPPNLLSLPGPLRNSACLQCQVRQVHLASAATKRIPKPTPFVPDHAAFLTLIGRDLSKHASKIPSWEALFSLSSQQLKDAGVEPARARRYLLWWRERYRNGIFGIGGDFKQVRDGIAELRIVEVPAATAESSPATLNRDAGTRRTIVNLPPTVSMPHDPANPVPEAEKVQSTILTRMAPPMKMSVAEAKDAQVTKVKIVERNSIAGTGIEYIKGFPGVARLRLKEGLWENKRGHKVDGGERRRAEVRSKRRAEYRKNAR